MIGIEEKLTELVDELRRTCREDDWWDFKETHYEDRAALLHDIICLANNRANRDAYLILGIRDKTYEVMGVESDPKRKNQQNIVDFLRSPVFAGQTRPRVEVHTIFLDGHEIDVFIVKNSTDVPYYLIEDYSDRNYKPTPPKKGKTVRAYHIYTRVMDNNTPIDKSADIQDVEYLWKKRFGLLQTPLEQIKLLLKKPEKWVEEEDRYYHSLFPQFTIACEWDEREDGFSGSGNRSFYHFTQTDNSTSYGTLKIFHYSTQMFSWQCTMLDGGRMTAPCPETEFIPYRSYGDRSICLRFYVTSDIQYLLLRFLEYHLGEANGQEAQISTRRLLAVIPVFETKDDVVDFKEYVHRHLGKFDELVSNQRKPLIEGESNRAAEALAEDYMRSESLVEMQKSWLEFRNDSTF